MRINCLSDLEVLLRGNRLYANGKNVSVDHLYATAAQSRFVQENLYGIYLANPEHAWMAVWMAITNRCALKKRQLEYYRPDKARGDEMGHLGIFVQGSTCIPDDYLVERAYLHLFDPKSLSGLSDLDLRFVSGTSRLPILRGLGFCWKQVALRNRTVDAWVPLLQQPLLVQIDSWQVALVCVSRLVPVVTVELMPDLLAELRERLIPIQHIPSDSYIRPSLAPEDLY